MKQKSLNDLKEEMRAVARGERKASPLPAAPLLAASSKEASNGSFDQRWAQVYGLSFS